MDRYFQTTILTMFNDQMVALRQEMSHQFKLLKLSYSPAPPSQIPAGHYTQLPNSTELDMEIGASAAKQ
eukprot:11581809-Ditylum_brightwellii.AAC.1